MTGEVHAANAAESSEHWNVEPVSVETNSNVALVLVVVAGGPELTTVCGAVWSIVHVYSAGDASALPAASFARTRKVCEPAAREVRFRGLVHAVHDEVTGTSSWHSKVRLPAGVTLSMPLKVKVAVELELAACGWPVMVVSGAIVSPPPGGGGGGAPFPSFRTSSGRLALSSRLWNCCSASWSSLASRMRKPLFALRYIACTTPATFHSR